MAIDLIGQASLRDCRVAVFTWSPRGIAHDSRVEVHVIVSCQCTRLPRGNARDWLVAIHVISL